MSEPQTGQTPPTPPPGSPAKKKGLSPLVWVLIGCAGLVVVGMVALIGGGFFVAKKAKDVAADFQENPARAAAELAVKMNPDLELVESGEDALTIRNRKTNEVATLDFEDIRDGDFRWTTTEGEGSIAFTPGGEGDAPTVTIEGPGGEVATYGGGEAADTDCFPTYPRGSDPVSNFSSTADGQRTEMFSFTTEDGAQEVIDFYAQAFDELGYEVEQSAFSGGGSSGGSVTATTDGGDRVVNLGLVSQGSQTQVTVNCRGPAG